MVVSDRKPMSEILGFLKNANKILHMKKTLIFEGTAKQYENNKMEESAVHSLNFLFWFVFPFILCGEG